MESTFRETGAIAEDDGVTFDPDTVRATEIRKDAMTVILTVQAALTRATPSLSDGLPVRLVFERGR